MIGTRAGHLVVVGECLVPNGVGNWVSGYIIVCRCCGRSRALAMCRMVAALKHDRCQGCRGEDK